MMTERSGMGTTLTATVIREDMLTIAQVGDSRAYLIRDGQINQVTDDHSWVAEQVRIGAMTLEEAQASPFRNIITRSIGTSSNVEPDITTHELRVGDIIVLCSDGLSGHLDMNEIRNMALEHSPSIAAMRMVEEANERGGRDNITVMVMSIRALIPYGRTEAEYEAEPVEVGAANTNGKPEKKPWGRRK
jgi:serine/threonine protein phosphatase PrpC